MKITKAELLEIIQRDTGDTERDHENADKALLNYINDEEITTAFDAVYKWYA